MTHITTIDRTTENHRSNIIIHDNWQWYIAEFDKMEQLQYYADTLGFTFSLVEEKPFLGDETNIYRCYEMSHTIDNNINGGFWKLSQLPEGVKPIKALSNGSIVTCYFRNDGNTITIYRPNPNATLENKNRYKSLEEYEKAVSNRVYYPNSLEFEAVYIPLSRDERITHCKIYGRY